MEFREMRRNRQKLAKEECEKILSVCPTGVLSVIGDGGYPYGVPVNFLYEHGCIYFHCAKSGHKLDALKKDPKVSFCVLDQDLVVPEKYTDYFRSVICFGKAGKVADQAEKIEILKNLGRKFAPDQSEERLEQEVEQGGRYCEIIKLEIEHMSGKQAKELF